jgi:Methyltransferase FkbM domain
LKEAVTPMKEKNGEPYFFLDVAANDARDISNSYALDLHYGWRGICLEPNPSYWYDHTRYRSRNSILVAAVAGNHSYPNEALAFRYDNLAFGGIVGFDNTDTNAPSQTEYTVSLAKVLQRFNAPSIIDYFSFDVEGAEFYGLYKFPFDLYRFRVVTIERPTEPLQELLHKNGYVFVTVFAHFGEQLWLHQDEHKRLLDSKVIDFAGTVTSAIKAVKVI